MTVSVDASRFQVVFVCSGNQARSALAEAFFSRYATNLHAAATSYGTQDVGGAPALPLAVEAGRRLGVDLTQHRAKSLRDARLDSPDLVLGFEQSHVVDAVIEAGAPSSRTFLLRELVELLGTSMPATQDPYEMDPYATARRRIEDASRRRARFHADSQAMTIEDPLRKSAKVMQRTAEEIDTLVGLLVQELFARP